MDGRWTREEEAKLRQMHRDRLPISRMAEELKKTEASIKSKIQRLKLGESDTKVSIPIYRGAIERQR